MQAQTTEYKHYENSVGNNLQYGQITTKYRYKVIRKELLKVYCKVAIEEACKRHKIKIVILKVMDEHVHFITDIPRAMSQAYMMQMIKGISSRIIFLLCENLRLRYPKGHFWNEGYFCEGCGSDLERAMRYIENQEQHHFFG
jgi:REP element-mobilizing transposase RayT